MFKMCLLGIYLCLMLGVTNLAFCHESDMTVYNTSTFESHISKWENGVNGVKLTRSVHIEKHDHTVISTPKQEPTPLTKGSPLNCEFYGPDDPWARNQEIWKKSGCDNANPKDLWRNVMGTGAADDSDTPTTTTQPPESLRSLPSTPGSSTPDTPDTTENHPIINTGDTPSDTSNDDDASEDVSYTPLSTQRPQPTQRPQQPAERKSLPPPKILVSLNQVYETEWMLRDLGRSVPQWIEFYNANATSINIKGWTFEYVVFHNLKKQIRTIRLKAFEIPAKSAVIFATHGTQRTNVDKENVYVLNIGYVLKRGWRLTAPDGTVVSQQPRQFGKTSLPDAWHGAVNFRQHQRTSFAYRSSGAVQQTYYGHLNDKGTPTFYKQSAPKAPSLRTMKKVTMWASLRKN